MIKFFRKIRQKLAYENNISQYSRYAIGEIVLVVIGILIALQINNWNQQQQANSLSKDYHQRLATELDSISSLLERDAERAKKVSTYIRQSVLILKKGVLTAEGKDTLDFTFKSFYQFIDQLKELKTFEELKSSGQIGLIYNQELKNQTFSFLTSFETISNIYQQMATQIDNKNDVFDKHITIFLDPNTTKNSLDYNFDKLVKDDFFINSLSRVGLHWREKQRLSRFISTSAKKLSEHYLAEQKKIK